MQLPLVARLSLGHWRLFAAVGFGVLLAATIMAAGVIYMDSLEDLGLRRELRSQPQETLALEIHANTSEVTRARHTATVGNVLLTVDDTAGWFTGETSWAVRSSAFRFPPTPDQVQAAQALGQVPVGKGAVFAILPDLADRIEVVSGSLPGPPTLSGSGGSSAVEVMVSGEDAAQFDLTVGGRFDLDTIWESDIRGPSATVVGIFDRADASDPFWRVPDDVFGFGIESRTARAVLVVHSDSYLETLATAHPEMSSSYGFYTPVDVNALNARNSAEALNDLNRLLAQGRSSVEGFRMATDLDNVVREFDLKVLFNRAPMTIVGILVLLLVLYYAVTLATLLVDAQRDEFSLLRTRGAGSRQIASVYGVEAAMLVAGAIVVGPLLAALVVHLAGYMPGVGGLNDGTGLPVAISLRSYQFALIGGLLSFVAMFVPAVRAARVGLLLRRIGVSRGADISFFRRYYIDLVLLALAVLLFRQLQDQGSLVGENVFGDNVVDEVTLAAPALLLLVAGLVLLRLFPLSMELLARGLSSRMAFRIVPETFVLGLWQLARNPASYSRLSLLFILTAGLGVFAANFGATLDRSFEDRALYSLGSDVRIEGVEQRPDLSSADLQSSVTETRGVSIGSPALRRNGSVTRPSAGVRYELLAVDPKTFGQTAWTRPDFFSGTLTDQLSLIETPAAERGIPLPHGAQWISARIRGFERLPGVDLVVTMRDADGRFYPILLGDLNPTSAESHTGFSCADDGDHDSAPGWCEIGGTVSPSGELRGEVPLIPKHPVTMQGIAVTLGVGVGDTLLAGSVLVDEITATMADGSRVTLARLGEPGEIELWHNMGTALFSDTDAFALTTSESETGVSISVAELRWGRGEFGQMRGFVRGDAPVAVPVLASKELIDITGVAVGDEILVVQDRVKIPVRLVSEVDYFPTLDPNEAPFIVGPLEPILAYVNTSNFARDIQSNELWIRAEPGEIASVSGALRTEFEGLGTDGVVLDKVTASESLAADPLTRAGWNALLGMSFVVVLLVSAFGFIVHAYVTYRDRVGELALLRTIGLSMRQLLALVAVEQFMVLVPAIAVGIVMGERVAGTIVPYLSNSGDGLRSVPPTISQIDWMGVALTLGTLAAVVVAVVVLVLIGVRRIAVQAVMRVAER